MQKIIFYFKDFVFYIILYYICKNFKIVVLYNYRFIQTFWFKRNKIFSKVFIKDSYLFDSCSNLLKSNTFEIS